ncbi:hypothetical protein BKA69DRAFT_1091091 [Paraphysoderma sedebokerense]|nr:hypothetical protein BKA69DRAFT_1091091 [Paraphysoderma sedebokerense]
MYAVFDAPGPKVIIESKKMILKSLDNIIGKYFSTSVDSKLIPSSSFSTVGVTLNHCLTEILSFITDAKPSLPSLIQILSHFDTELFSSSKVLSIDPNEITSDSQDQNPHEDLEVSANICPYIPPASVLTLIKTNFYVKVSSLPYLTPRTAMEAQEMFESAFALLQTICPTRTVVEGSELDARKLNQQQALSGSFLMLLLGRWYRMMVEERYDGIMEGLVKLGVFGQRFGARFSKSMHPLLIIFSTEILFALQSHIITTPISSSHHTVLTTLYSNFFTILLTSLHPSQPVDILNLASKSLCKVTRALSPNNHLMPKELRRATMQVCYVHIVGSGTRGAKGKVTAKQNTHYGWSSLSQITLIKTVSCSLMFSVLLEYPNLVKQLMEYLCKRIDSGTDSCSRVWRYNSLKLLLKLIAEFWIDGREGTLDAKLKFLLHDGCRREEQKKELNKLVRDSFDRYQSVIGM